MSKKKGIITLVCVIAFLLAGTWTAVFGDWIAQRQAPLQTLSRDLIWQAA